MKIRRFFASLAQRLFVPHCEDCFFYRHDGFCKKTSEQADYSRRNRCGTQARYFEKKK